MRKSLFSLVALALLCLGAFASASSVPKQFCDSSRPEFLERHAAVIASENKDYMAKMWKNDVSVIVQAPIGPNGELQWIEVAQVRFYMNVTYNEEGCFWDERQFWERVDPSTGQVVEIGCQRIDLLLNGPTTGIDFLAEGGQGRGFEERASVYDVEWFQGRYLQESVSVSNLKLIEYGLGDKLVVGGWYTPEGEVAFQNTIISYVPGESRTYTYSTIERYPGVPQFKVLASFDAINVTPPQHILDAANYLENAINDPNFVGRLNPATGYHEIVYELNQSQKRSTKNCLNTKCQMNGLSLSKHAEEFINGLNK